MGKFSTAAFHRTVFFRRWEMSKFVLRDLFESLACMGGLALYSANEEGLKCKAVDRFTLVFRCIGIEFNIYRAHYTLNPSRGVCTLVLDSSEK